MLVFHGTSRSPTASGTCSKTSAHCAATAVHVGRSCPSSSPSVSRPVRRSPTAARRTDRALNSFAELVALASHRGSRGTCGTRWFPAKVRVSVLREAVRNESAASTKIQQSHPAVWTHRRCRIGTAAGEGRPDPDRPVCQGIVILACCCQRQATHEPDDERTHERGDRQCREGTEEGNGDPA